MIKPTNSTFSSTRDDAETALRNVARPTTMRSSVERGLGDTLSIHEQAHLRILKIIEAEPDISQRRLAALLGVSLGKTNFLLRALLEKGLIKVGNFRRATNKLKYVYLLTPKGVGERVRMTRAYLARKEAEYEALDAEIRMLKQEFGRR